MSNKNRKEKTSFWKKIGLGKSKSSISSLKSEIQRQDQHDTHSVKSKRFSALSINHLPPKPTEQKQIPPIPTTPKPTQFRPPSSPVETPNIEQQPSPPSSPIPDTTRTSVTQNAVVEDDNEKNVVVSSDTNNKQEAEENLDASYVVVSETSQELKATITELKAELEKEKATVSALQKQKEAVTKDLDYLELTVDELFTEKTDLLQQLEDEKIKSQHHLDDLNILLEKMKSNADNARDQSFAVDQSRMEFEAYQKKANQEKDLLLNELKEKDELIQELKHKLSQSQEQVELVKQTMNQLVTTHASELSRVTAQLQLVQQQQQVEKENSLHTPNGSPRIKPEQNNDGSHPSAYHTPQSMSRIDSSDQYRTPKQSMEHLDQHDLDNQLMKLIKEKEKLQSDYSKIPLSGGGPQARKRKEELEASLDHVDSQLSKVKQKIKKS